MKACLIYSPALAAYDLGADHPLRPERFTLAVSLMRAYGLLAPPAPPGPAGLESVEPAPATRHELELVHDPGYIEAVKRASRPLDRENALGFGLGTLDNPVFPGMHEASALVAGASVTAMRQVLSGAHARAFSIAGGLHHAHRARASGFCVYNDCAVAIASALETRPELRLAYVDIDAHHGDGVQEAFYSEPRVLTISLHETGRRLFPGTGWTDERGTSEGVGAAANVPLPEGATDECYAAAFDLVVEPLVRSFGPDLIFAQCGADAHHSDPLTTMGLTVGGYALLVRRIVALADEVCGGRIVALGGGGYSWPNVVPRCWTILGASLAGASLEAGLPARWRETALRVSGAVPPAGLYDDDAADTTGADSSRLLEETTAVCEEVMSWTPSSSSRRNDARD